MTEEEFSYRTAGVDLEVADALKERLEELVESTRTGGVRSGYGSFGGRFSVESGELVASADGVGTKLRVAFRADRHDTVGEDLVNHCVNDILTEGAEPLFFLDYLATGELEGEVAYRVVEGIARGCRSNGCALLGGETAEMPGFYADGEYDLAGFIVGRVAWPEVAARELRAGDRLLALASSGIHTNGYSFARSVLFDRLGLDVTDPWPESGGSGAASGRSKDGEDATGTRRTVGEVLLRVHRSYLSALRPSCDAGDVKALAHITGGGIPGNLGRVLPGDLDARVDTTAWVPPEEFGLLARESGASAEEMYRVFNMGAGMIVIASEDRLDEVRRRVDAAGVPAHPCGELVEGTGRVELQGVG